MASEYFSDLAEQSFQTSPTDERLFLHINGFWSKPYIVPDQETEKRLFKKQLLMWQIVWTTVFVSQAYLFIAIPGKMYMLQWFLFDLLAILIFFYSINFFLFRKEFRTLKRSSVRFPFLSYYRAMAKRASATALLFGILVNLVLLWILFRIVEKESNGLIGWFFIIIASLSALSAVYTYYLKVVVLHNKNGVDNHGEA